jgi:thiamine pyrophosphokinase
MLVRETADPCGEGRGAAGLTAAVFLNGRYEDEAWDRRLAELVDLLVAADGGARRLRELGLWPDVLVGDLDSLDPEAAAALTGAGVPLVRHPVRKDFTDGELAVDEALARGAGCVLLAGALGDLDHELGHLAVLRRLTGRGVRARLVAPRLLVAVLVAPVRACLSGAAGARVSLAALSGDAVLSLRGLSYPLDRHTLRADGCLGLGNEAIADETIVEVHSGAAALLAAVDPLAVTLGEEALAERAG